MTSQSEHDAILARLMQSDPYLAELRDKPMTLEIAEPPFWPGIQVAAVEIDLGHKPQVFRYAIDAAQVMNLATAYDFETVGLRAGLNLERNWVPVYLRFFVSVTDRKLQIVERPDEPRWLPSSQSDPIDGPIRRAAAERIHPVYVDDGASEYRAIATLIDSDRALHERNYKVTRTGSVELESDNVLMEDLPVPYVGF
jgi:hypothetical protein